MVAGINGDFFNTGNGLPIGILVSEGNLLSSDAGYYAIGFRADGSAVIGKPGVTVSADLGYQGTDSAGYAAEIIRTIAGVNKARVSTGGIYLYTYDFNDRHTTGNTEAGVDVLCTIVDGSLSIGGTLTLRGGPGDRGHLRHRHRPGSGGPLRQQSRPMSTIPTPCGTSLWAATITVTVSAADAAWNDVQYAVGALYSLVENGGRGLRPARRRQPPHRRGREG